MTNFSISDVSLPPCSWPALYISILSTNASVVSLNSSRITSHSDLALSVQFGPVLKYASLRLQNCVLERAETLLSLSLLDKGLIAQLQAIDVTFQSAAGTYKSAPVYITATNALFQNCKWLHNKGAEAGALGALNSTIYLKNCSFDDNQCQTGPGDIWFYSGFTNTAGITLENCVFTGSKSINSAASIFIASGMLQSGALVNCTFRSIVPNYGAVVHAAHSNSSLFLTNVSFENINASASTLLLLEAAATVEGLRVVTSTFVKGIATASNSRFTVACRNNWFQGNIGSPVWIDTCNFTDQDSTYINNIPGIELYHLGADTTSLLIGLNFYGNRPSNVLGMLHFEGPNAFVDAQKCVFVGNSWPTSLGVVQLEQANASFTSCEFKGNEVAISVVMAQLSSLNLENCSFSDGADAIQLDKSQAVLSSILLFSIQPSLSAIFLRESSLSISHAIIRSVTGPTSCLLTGQLSTVHLYDVLMSDFFCELEVISMTQSELYLQNIEITHINNETNVVSLVHGALTGVNVSLTEVETSESVFKLVDVNASLHLLKVTSLSHSLIMHAVNSTVRLVECTFVEIHTEKSAAVLECVNCWEVEVSRCTFDEISAALVGGVIAEAENFIVRDSLFRSLHSANSGALYVTAGLLLISNSIFALNSAKSSSAAGGALSFQAASSLIRKTVFFGNSAAVGGALFWTSTDPVLTDNEFEANQAARGVDCASSVLHLRPSNDTLFLVSGQLYGNELVVYIEDSLNQTVKADNSTRATLGGVELTGQVQAVATMGRLVFSVFTAFSEPGVWQGWVEAGELKTELKFVFRECERGELRENLTCKRCFVETYSLDVRDTECSFCPSSAECPGNGQLYPRPGYWRPHFLYDGLFICPRRASCLGHSSFASQTGICDSFYSGNLCQNCAEGATRAGRDRCISCPGNTGLKLMAGGLGPGLPAFWLIFVFASTRKEGRMGLLLRLLLDYLQLTVLVTDFDLNWPESLQRLFLPHHYLGNAPQLFLPVHCYSASPFFWNSLAATIVPILITALFTAIWVLVWLLYQLFQSITISIAKLVSLLIVSFTYLQPFIIRISLSAFVCTTIEPGEDWLRTDMNVRCWDKQHMIIALAASLPSLILWGVATPALTVLFLKRYQAKLTEGPIQIAYFTTGLRESYLWWVVAVNMFKCGVAVLYVCTANVSTESQTLLLVLLLASGIWLHVLCAPFLDPAFNRFSIFSLTVILVTAFTGLHFTTTNTHIVLQLILFGLHIWLWLMWLVAAGGLDKLRSLLRVRAQEAGQNIASDN